jgi:hypothetical protein
MGGSGVGVGAGESKNHSTVATSTKLPSAAKATVMAGRSHGARGSKTSV